MKRWFQYSQVWWMALFCLSAFWVYGDAIQKKQVTHQGLQKQWTDLLAQKDRLKKQQEDLALQVSSQNDPEWIQMTLMRELGLVPEGQMKVFFQPNQDT